MNVKLIILTAVISFSSIVCAQKQYNNWYFGENAGLSFNNSEVVSLYDSEMNQNEGCSSISDSNGSLLFYTDGVSVWNRNHVIMNNGFGLFGHLSSTQSALIVQKPLSDNLYYIFTQGSAYDPDYGLHYSILDE